MGAKLLVLSILLQISCMVATLENCADVEQSSLAFIIADAASMANYIEQVKIGINEVFNAVLNSKSSPIENFLLVSFDDLGSKANLLNRDPDALKQALNDIRANGDAGSKYSMLGIQLALEKALPLSHLYVFTDAPAKDSQNYEQVKRLAQEKSAQISFVLIGKQNYEQDPDFTTYFNLARATSGLVMHVDASDVPEIMHYIRDSAEYCKVQLFSGELESGNHLIKFNVGVKQTNVQISATGDHPKLDAVYNSANVEQNFIMTTNLTFLIVARLLTEEAGEYTAFIGSNSVTKVNIDSIKVTGFSHGFSTVKPYSLKNTTILPKSGVKSYLAVKLHQYRLNVKLLRVKFLDLVGNVSLEYPLEVTDEKEGFYVTDLIDVPRNMFRISVVGYDVDSHSTISSMGRTPLEAI